MHGLQLLGFLTIDPSWPMVWRVGFVKTSSVHLIKAQSQFNVACSSPFESAFLGKRFEAAGADIQIGCHKVLCGL